VLLGLAGIVAVGLLLALGVEKIQYALGDLGRQRPRADFLAGVAFGLTPLLPMYAVYRRIRAGVARPWRGWVVPVAALWVLVFLGLPPNRSPEYAEMRVRAPYVQPGTLTGGAFAVAAWVALTRRYRAPMPPTFVAKPRPPRPGHTDVRILDVRPSPGDPDPWTPYYVATCGCGWVGRSVVDEQVALDEARRHAPGVEPVTQRTAT
jgi:hypothetical protein